MPGLHSKDLRRRVVAAVEGGERPEAVAARFEVSRSTVYRWLRAAREEGRYEAKPMLGGREPLIRGDVAAALVLVRLVEAGIDPARLVFVDESAALTNMVRGYARIPRGTRAHGSASSGEWRRLTVVGALRSVGMVGAMCVEAASGGAVFRAFLEQVLLPELRVTRPDAILVMDNLAAHKARAVRALLDRAGFAYLYLPPYSPDLNPIEHAWAKVKARLRAAAARTTDALHAAVGAALAAITSEDARDFLRHAGYGCPN